MKSIGFFCVLISVFFFSCSSDLHDEVTRTYADPVIQKPLVRSVVERNKIFLSWNMDFGTDKYILERQKDETPGFEEVYRGSGTSFVDVLPEGRYYYRMRFLRGRKMFGPSSPVLGVSSNISLDEHEPNNNRTSATHLENVINASLYYYKASDGQEVYDHDWYFIVLPPRSFAEVTVDEDELDVGRDTHFRVHYPGEASYTIKDSHFFEVENVDNWQRPVLFYIEPEPSEYLEANIAGGSVIRYKIQIEWIQYIVQ